MKTLIGLFILTFFVIGCKKATTTVVNIHMYKQINQSALKDKTIEIWKRNKNGSTELIYSGKTNEEGRFSYRFTDKSNVATEYYFQFPGMVQQEPSFEKFFNVPNRVLKKNETNNFEIAYGNYVYSAVYVSNVNCFSSTDRFRFRMKFMNHKQEWSEWSSFYSGCNTIKEFYFAYEDFVIYEYEVERNGVMSVKQDTLVVRPQEVADTLFIN